MKKKKINLGKTLTLSKEKLNQLNEEQLHHFMGGRMARATDYGTNDGGKCSIMYTDCCSTSRTACC
ncbi:class I lanthipeptide [Longitalea luteola]|uniref:class I lanthipeptide n=1 Tax=Longitalea luteola TaxID=2812563 RepID=UPI001A958760|nr:class I lanthipeptide [Longitalea luteola]